MTIVLLDDINWLRNENPSDKLTFYFFYGAISVENDNL